MPTFTIQGEIRFVSYITGPAHILLGLRFTVGASSATPSFICKPAAQQWADGKLDENAIAEAVATGVAEVSESLNVAEIVYVADDTPRYPLYAHCAKLLAERFLQGLP
jgi:hypothetical protein